MSNPAKSTRDGGVSATERSTEGHEQVEAVLPSGLASVETIPLTSLDLTRPFSWDTAVYGFKNAPRAANFMDRAQLKAALAKTLCELPILGGELQNCDGTLLTPRAVTGDMQVRLAGRGAWFCAQDLSDDFAETQARLAVHTLPDRLRFATMERTMYTPFLPRHRQVPLLAVKASYFACGSVVLVVMVNQLVADSQSCHAFMKLWAAHFRREPPADPPRDARHLLVPPGPPDDFVQSVVREWSNYPCPRAKQPDELQSCLIAIPAAALGKLICQVNSSSEGRGQWARPDDLVCVLVWRAISRARGLAGGAVSGLHRAANIRGVLGLGAGSFCNALLPNMTLLRGEKLLGDTPGGLAMKLRRRESRISDGDVRDFITAASFVRPRSRPLWKLGATARNNLYVSCYSHLDWEGVRFHGPPSHWFHVSRATDGWLAIYPAMRSLRIVQLCTEASTLARLQGDIELKRWGFQVIPSHAISASM